MYSLRDFADSNPRFFLPVDRFGIDVSYTDMYLQPAELQFLRNVLVEAILGAVRKYPAISPGELRFGTPQVAARTDEDDTEAAYAYAQISTPVYDCAVQVGKNTLRLSKIRASFSEWIQTLNLFGDIIAQLIPADESEGSFADVFSRRQAIYSVAFAWEYRLSVGHLLAAKNRSANNMDLARRLVRLSLDPAMDPASSPFGALQPEKVVRADASIIGIRAIGESVRQVYVGAQMPHNVTQQDIDVSLSCKSGGSQGVPFELSHLHDFETPAILFFKEMILDGFFEHSFGDCSVEARL